MDQCFWIISFLIYALLTAGKKTLTHKWMMQLGPTVDKWIDMTIGIYRMEKVTFFLNLKLEMFRSHCAKWVNYIKYIICINYIIRRYTWLVSTVYLASNWYYFINSIFGTFTLDANSSLNSHKKEKQAHRS